LVALLALLFPSVILAVERGKKLQKQHALLIQHGQRKSTKARSKATGVENQ